MMVLDTDHFSEFLKGTSPEAIRLHARLSATTAPVAVTIVTCEEIMRGWLSLIHRQRPERNQIFAYAELQRLLSSLARWKVLPWNDAAASHFESMRSRKIRIGTMDLKIASIALAQGAIVLTRNRVDFGLVPNLTTADWLS